MLLQESASWKVVGLHSGASKLSPKVYKYLYLVVEFVNYTKVFYVLAVYCVHAVELK